MDSQKIEGIVLQVTKYKDYDALATVFTPSGLRRVKFTGVRRPNAKFAFAAQPFCHAEFLVTSGKDYAVVTGVDQKTDFFSLTQNIDVYFTATEWLKIIKRVVTEEQDASEIYQKLFIGLSVLMINGDPTPVVDCWLKVQVLLFLGTFNSEMRCVSCRKPLSGGGVIDLSTGALYCPSCAPANGTVLSKNVLSFFNQCATCPLSQIFTNIPPYGVLTRAQEVLTKLMFSL